MALIKSIAEVKLVLRVSNMDDNASIPDMDAAEEKYILPVLGEELYDGIVDGYVANDLSDIEKKLLLKIQKPLAAFAYYDDLAAMHLRITEGGLRRTTTDNEPSAFRWEFLEAKEFLTNRAFQGLESLYVFLEKNVADFEDWKNSDAYKRRNKFLIKNGYQFSDEFQLYQPLRTFAALHGIMDYVEENCIADSIGEEFLAELKLIETPSESEQKVISWLKKATAFYSISQASVKLPVRISDAGFTINMATTVDTQEGQRQQAGNNQLDALISKCENDGDMYMNKVTNFLNEKATDSLFSTYKASSYYSKPGADITPLKRNDDRKNLYL